MESNQNKGYLLLAEIANSMEGSYPSKKHEWDNSPFRWIVHNPSSRQKGAIGEKLVRNLLRQQGFTVADSHGSDSDMLVNGYKIEVKMSTLWKKGIYTFQQIRDQQYDILFCIGLSPHNAHAWVAPKHEIVLNKIRPQHTGKTGSDTRWISFSPSNNPYAWMQPSNGNLIGAIEILRELTTPSANAR